MSIELSPLPNFVIVGKCITKGIPSLHYNRIQEDYNKPLPKRSSRITYLTTEEIEDFLWRVYRLNKLGNDIKYTKLEEKKNCLQQFIIFDLHYFFGV